MKAVRNLEARITGDMAVWYIRGTVAGKRIYQSTGLAAVNENLPAARVMRDRVLRAAHEDRFADIEAAKVRRASPCASIGEMIDRYEEVCRVRREPRPVSVRTNVAGLLRIVQRVHGVDEAGARGMSGAVLTDELVERWAAAAVPDGVGREEAESAQRTCVATLRHARGLFRPSILRQYRGLRMPDLRAFMDGFACACPAVRYEMPAEEEYGRIIGAARGGLARERPDLYAAFVLVFDLAMRADEAAAARWSWIERSGDGWQIRIVDRPAEDWRPKGRGGAVPVAPGVLAALEAAAGRREGDPFILPGGSHGARYELCMQGIADWMRGLGWRRRKCAHELRKLKGSFWRGRAGLDRAHEWLRHSQYQVTLDYYARIPVRDEPQRIDG